eukprot:311705-Pyramimonas_sp.AAC.1
MPQLRKVCRTGANALAALRALAQIATHPWFRRTRTVAGKSAAAAHGRNGLNRGWSERGGVKKAGTQP